MSSLPSFADAALRLDRVAFARSGEAVFGPVSLALGSGAACAIAGRNGAGKTTLLHVVAGLLAPTAGRVLLEHAGEVVDARSGQVALLGHQPGLKQDLSARANLEFRAALAGDAGVTDVDAALGAVGLDGFATVPLREMSAGQRRRVALACLARSRAVLWLLDEPFANLDAGGRAVVEGLIGMHRAAGGMVLLTSHALENLPPGALTLDLGAAS